MLSPLAQTAGLSLSKLLYPTVTSLGNTARWQPQDVGELSNLRHRLSVRPGRHLTFRVRSLLRKPYNQRCTSLCSGPYIT